MNRSKVEDVLFALRIPANNKGFIYIPDALEIYEENGCDISVTKWVYPEVARKNKTTPAKVERAIRYAFNIADQTSGNYEKYIGLVNTTNSAALISLYKHITRGNGEPEKEENIAEPDLKEISPELEFAIRRILREELRRIFPDR